MESTNFKIKCIKSCGHILKAIGFSIVVIFFLTSMSLANDKSDNVKSLNPNQSDINKNIIKENYFQDTKLFETFNANLIDMKTQEVVKNIVDISKKYNIDISNVSENIIEVNNDGFNEEKIIVQSPDDEKILLAKLSGKITIKDIIDFYKLGINLYYPPVSKNTVLVKIKAEDITKLKSFPFINGIREYKPDDKINPDDKIRIYQMIQLRAYPNSPAALNVIQAHAK